MATERSMGFLLQGVSQQPRAIRSEGQVTEQINRFPDVILGNTSRPAAKRTSKFGWRGDEKYVDIDLEGRSKFLGYRKSGLGNSLRIIDKETGNQETVNVFDSDALDYLGPDMQFYVYDNTIFCLNRDKVVQMDPVDNRYNDLIVQGCVVYHLGGSFARTYKIKVVDKRRSGDVTYEASYTTPVGTEPSHATNSSSVYIMQQLTNQLISNGMSPENGWVTTRVEDYLWIDKDSSHPDQHAPFEVSVTDSEGGEVMFAVQGTINDAGELPRHAPEGFFITVGSKSRHEDAVHYRFTTHGGYDLYEGFGQPGIWKETAAPFTPNGFDLKTMPHIIERVQGNWVFKRADWFPRRVGNGGSPTEMPDRFEWNYDDGYWEYTPPENIIDPPGTNPYPSFVGRKIRDISEFQSRLVLISGNSAVMSRTNIPTDFWRQSMTSVLDNDPIDIRSTKQGNVSLEWIVPFDRDLIIFGNDAQFLITGSTGLTPTNASMVVTTGFVMSSKAKPVTTGRTVMMPFIQTRYSGINEFFTTDEQSTNAAEPITKTLARYIEGEVTKLTGSTNDSLLCMLTDHDNQTVYVYKYMWEANEKVQSAWGKWRFNWPVRHISAGQGEVTVILDHGNGQYLSINRINLDRPIDEDLEYHVTLDENQYIQLQDYRVTVDLPDPTFVAGYGTRIIGNQITPIEDWEAQEDVFVESVFEEDVWLVEEPLGPNEYIFSAEEVDPDGWVYVGERFDRELWPTMPMPFDREGKPIVGQPITIQAFLVNYTDSGEMTAEQISPWRTDPRKIALTWFPTADDRLDPDGSGVRSGQFIIPWGERDDRSELCIRSNDFRPDTILEMIWRGQIPRIRGRSRR